MTNTITTNGENTMTDQPVTIDPALRFNQVDIFRMFNVDMVAAGEMDAADVRGNNRFLIRFPKHNDPEKRDPASVPCKVDPKTHEIINGTTERIAMLKAHAARIQADPELCPKRTS